MRVIFEEIDRELFFEVVLTSLDFDQIELLGGVIGDFICEISEAKTINVYIRKEKDLCHLSKAQKPKLERAFHLTSKKKSKRVSRKNKPLRSLIAKREGKKLLRKVNNENLQESQD